MKTILCILFSVNHSYVFFIIPEVFLIEKPERCFKALYWFRCIFQGAT